MKIGIVTSGNENLMLFKFLQKYDHEYVVYYDQLFWPYGDKPFDIVEKRVLHAIKFLVEQGCEKIIVPPSMELSLLRSGSKQDLRFLLSQEGQSIILPLFQVYLSEYCFKQSLVGKIGLIGDFCDMENIQDLVHTYSKEYQLTENQKAIKKFHFPFKYRTKEVQLWKYYLSTLSYSNPMVNKIIKFDLRYLKDANVDTIIPLNYGYFNFEKTISKYFNFKKQRFHTLEKLEKAFLKNSLDTSKYDIKIFYTGTDEFLKREKRLMWLLEKGKNITCQRELIEE